MIDSEVVKIVDYPENSITIKAYEVKDVLERTGGHEAYLSEYASYIDSLLESDESVPQYITSHKKTSTTIFDHPDYVAHISSL
jgi:hypothetical protein